MKSFLYGLSILLTIVVSVSDSCGVGFDLRAPQALVSLK